MFDIGTVSRVTSVAGAIEALCRDPGALLVAGGTDVLIQVREGKLAGRNLVSIRDVPQLQGMEREWDGTIVIGPLATFSQVARHPLITEHIPALGFAVSQAGGPQLRNMGTIGGNLCNGATSADSAATLLTLNAQLCIEGPAGRRRLPLEQFYLGPGKVALSHGEVLTAIRIASRDYEGYSGCYIKFAQRAAMDIATLSCAVHLRLAEGKRAVGSLRLAFGVAAPTPIRCHGTENAAQGRPLNGKLLRQVAEDALRETSPRTSWRATKAFRRQLIFELSRRALTTCIERAGGVLV